MLITLTIILILSLLLIVSLIILLLPVSILPLRSLYILSDFVFYPLLYHVIHYRRKVVRCNLERCFPLKSTAQIDCLEKEVYHHLADVIIETFHAIRMSPAQIQEHINYENHELLDDYIAQYGTVIVVLGHYTNWEWGTSFALHFKGTPTRFVALYRQLRNPFFNKLFLRIRSHFGGDYIEKNELLRYMIEHREQPKLICLIADQHASPRSARVPVTFMGIKTTFLAGAEMLSKKYGYPIIYADFYCVSRGHYSVRFIPIHSKHPTAEYASLLEQSIVRQPEQWLWTHNRFKYDE